MRLRLATVLACFGFPAWAESPDISLNGDLKNVFSGTFPYEHPLMPEDAVANGTLDARAKLKLDAGKVFLFEMHHVLSGGTVADDRLGFGTGSGAMGSVPEAVDLGWEGVSGPHMQLEGRTDRLYIKHTSGPVVFTLGRQAISFGVGQFFSPLDLVMPFHPAVVDREYKPGVDAVRADAFVGPESQLTVVAAHGGEWAIDGSVMVVNGQTTVGASDLGLLLGEVYGDEVLGVSGLFPVGVVAVHAEASFTLPDEDPDEPFVRAVSGLLVRPSATTTLQFEASYQGVGADSRADYLRVMQTDRFARGELWAMGQWYLSSAVSQEFTPRLRGDLGAIANLIDGSALILPSLAISVADDVELIAGGTVGLGKRPSKVGPLDMMRGDFGVQSEFGMYPTTVFTQTKVYF